MQLSSNRVPVMMVTSEGPIHLGNYEYVHLPKQSDHIVWELEDGQPDLRLVITDITWKMKNFILRPTIWVIKIRTN